MTFLRSTEAIKQAGGLRLYLYALDELHGEATLAAFDAAIGAAAKYLDQRYALDALPPTRSTMAQAYEIVVAGRRVAAVDRSTNIKAAPRPSVAEHRESRIKRRMSDEHLMNIQRTSPESPPSCAEHLKPTEAKEHL